MSTQANLRLTNNPEPDAEHTSAERDKGASPQPSGNDDAYHFAAQLAHRGVS